MASKEYKDTIEKIKLRVDQMKKASEAEEEAEKTKKRQ